MTTATLNRTTTQRGPRSLEREACIRFACACGKGLKVAPEYAGRRAPCPRCGQALRVPLISVARPTRSPRPGREAQESRAPSRAEIDSARAELRGQIIELVNLDLEPWQIAHELSQRTGMSQRLARAVVNAEERSVRASGEAQIAGGVVLAALGVGLSLAGGGVFVGLIAVGAGLTIGGAFRAATGRTSLGDMSF